MDAGRGRGDDAPREPTRSPEASLETVARMPYAGGCPDETVARVLWLVVEGLARDVHDDVALVEQVLADGEQARLGVEDSDRHHALAVTVDEPDLEVAVAGIEGARGRDLDLDRSRCGSRRHRRGAAACRVCRAPPGRPPRRGLVPDGSPGEQADHQARSGHSGRPGPDSPALTDRLIGSAPPDRDDVPTSSATVAAIRSQTRGGGLSHRLAPEAAAARHEDGGPSELGDGANALLAAFEVLRAVASPSRSSAASASRSSSG